MWPPSRHCSSGEEPSDLSMIRGVTLRSLNKASKGEEIQGGGWWGGVGRNRKGGLVAITTVGVEWKWNDRKCNEGVLLKKYVLRGCVLQRRVLIASGINGCVLTGYVWKSALKGCVLNGSVLQRCVPEECVFIESKCIENKGIERVCIECKCTAAMCTFHVNGSLAQFSIHRTNEVKGDG